MRLAAIDIGSNAVRLLISETNELGTTLKKLNFFRVPVRLGFDVFEYGCISSARSEMLIQTLKAFRHMINAYSVDHVIVCATSAMRDATNSTVICEDIFQKTGLHIEIISGETEARLLFENHIAEQLSDESAYMYIDVGGGSTEISVFSRQKLAFNRSYNIGTIRLLKDHVEKSVWDEMKADVKQNAKVHGSMIGIGSGGNINKIFSLSKRKEGKPISLEILKKYHEEMSCLSTEERIQRYNIREDRADVIVPALQIYIQVMRWAGIEDILVPKIGLVDGLAEHLKEQLLGYNRSISTRALPFQLEASSSYF